MGRHRKKKELRSIRPLLILLLILAGLAVLVVKDAVVAVSVLRQDRINIAAYGSKTAVFSFGLRDEGNYIIPFYPDLKIDVPGGYGQYRVGALGKLISLERKPEILKKAFSRATSSFIDYYFYQPSTGIIFGGQGKDPQYPGLADILLYRTNANLGERLALYYLFLKTQPQDFTLLHTVETEKRGERYLLTDNMAEMYQGYFFRKTYSEEKKDVQLLYTADFASAEIVSGIIEGNGIRVSDISQDDNKPDHCLVKEQKKPFSQTAMVLAGFFGCELVQGKTDIYDVVVELGNKEREW